VLHVGAVQALDVVLREHGRHGADALELGLDFLEQPRLQHGRVHGRLVGVVREYVPAAELDILQIVQGHELLDLGAAALGAFPEADRPHLGERADRLAEVLAHRVNPGHDRGGHGAHPRDEDSKFALCRFDLVTSLH